MWFAWTQRTCKKKGFLRIINNVRASKQSHCHTDGYKGPEVRTTVAENDAIEIKLAGDIIKVVGNPDMISNNEYIVVNPSLFCSRDLNVGDDICPTMAKIDPKVEKQRDYLLCKALERWHIGKPSKQCSGVRINLPSSTNATSKISFCNWKQYWLYRAFVCKKNRTFRTFRKFWRTQQPHKNYFKNWKPGAQGQYHEILNIQMACNDCPWWFRHRSGSGKILPAFSDVWFASV